VCGGWARCFWDDATQSRAWGGRSETLRDSHVAAPLKKRQVRKGCEGTEEANRVIPYLNETSQNENIHLLGTFRRRDFFLYTRNKEARLFSRSGLQENESETALSINSSIKLYLLVKVAQFLNAHALVVVAGDVGVRQCGVNQSVAL
jgi:hypothetical protein